MRKVGLLVVVAAIALAFAIPAFAGDCGCNKCAAPKPCNTCPKPCSPCVTCGQPCNVIQGAADTISGIQRPPMPCMVNPVTRVAETICPGAGKEKNMLKPWYSCDSSCTKCNTCAKPCNTCAKPSCSSCSK